MSSAPPTDTEQPHPADDQPKRSGFRWNNWNLLLLVPLIMLITPWFNFDKPRLAGIPFFYWYQLLFVLVGVASVWLVYAMTRDKRGDPPTVILDDASAANASDEGDGQ